MVDSSYMLDKAPPPSVAKRYIDTTLIPKAIDVAAAGEMLAERAARRTRLNPAAALGIAACTGFTLALLMRRAARV